MRELIADKLYVGNALEARDLTNVFDHAIAAIIDLAAEETSINAPRELVYCRFPILDGGDNDSILLRSAIEAGVNFVTDRRRTLVACSAGVSRSPAIAAAIVSHVQGIALDEALKMVADAGPTDISPALWSDVVGVLEMPRKTNNSIAFIASTIQALESNKSLADRAIAQTKDEHLHRPLDPHTNSIAVIVKHVAGNLRSRWTDFLATDGEKPERNRDDEFIDTFTDRNELLAYWESGWARLFDTLRSLNAEDLGKTITIRGEAHTVPRAVQRSLGHTCYHIGQIVQLARHYADDDWETLTIARGKSQEFIP